MRTHIKRAKTAENAGGRVAYQNHAAGLRLWGIMHPNLPLSKNVAKFDHPDIFRLCRPFCIKCPKNTPVALSAGWLFSAAAPPVRAGELVNCIGKLGV